MNKIQRQTKFHNDSMRQVSHVYSYRLDRFLSQSNGNLLLNGGTKNKRRECLLRLIQEERAKNTESIVVFSDDKLFESELISLAQTGKIGKLIVCSEEYPNYDFFYKMNKNLICEYFRRLALEKGIRDTSEISSYIGAFLTILSQQSSINFSAMNYFARNTDTNIKDSTGDVQSADVLIASPRGSVTARSLMHESYEALSPITTSECSTGICIGQLIEQDCVFLVNTPSYNDEFFALYFAMELKALMNKNFMCIFDDSTFLNNETMRSVVNTMKQRQRVTVVISHENIVSVGDTESTLKNFNRDLILLNGNTPYVDLQYVISSFGQYTHMAPMANKSTPPRLFFTFYRSEGESAVPYSRDRVILQEEYGNEALLKGGSGSQILIAKRLLT